jgi:hypothetical protein
MMLMRSPWTRDGDVLLTGEFQRSMSVARPTCQQRRVRRLLASLCMPEPRYQWASTV